MKDRIVRKISLFNCVLNHCTVLFRRKANKATIFCTDICNLRPHIKGRSKVVQSPSSLSSTETS